MHFTTLCAIEYKTLGIPTIAIHLHVPRSSPFARYQASSKPRYIKITRIKSPCKSGHLERRGGGCRLKVKENKSSAFPFEIRIFLFHIKGKLDRGR